MKLENKEYHDGGFQQQSPRHLVDINEHMDSRNDHEINDAVECYLSGILFDEVNYF